MTASAVSWGVPNCDGTIHRASLVSGLLRDHRSLIVLAAPSGFGKTVTAAQLSAAHSGPVAWVSVDGQPLDSSRILTLLGQVLESRVEHPSRPRPDRMESPDYLSSIRSTLAAADAMDMWLVIDDAVLGPGDSCNHVLRDLRARLSPFLSRVLITVRELDPYQLSGLPDALDPRRA